MVGGQTGVWRSRFAVIRAAGVLLAAHVLVKTATLAQVRRVLAASAARGTIHDLPAARTVGQRVERAAMRLPIRTKCLARAIATLWLLFRQGLAGRLVIAVHRRDRSSEHAFHAWVEHGDEVVVGHCVREDYAPVMTIGAG